MANFFFLTRYQSSLTYKVIIFGPTFTSTVRCTLTEPDTKCKVVLLKMLPWLIQLRISRLNFWHRLRQNGSRREGTSLCFTVSWRWVLSNRLIVNIVPSFMDELPIQQSRSQPVNPSHVTINGFAHYCTHNASVNNSMEGTSFTVSWRWVLSNRLIVNIVPSVMDKLPIQQSRLQPVNPSHVTINGLAHYCTHNASVNNSI